MDQVTKLEFDNHCRENEDGFSKINARLDKIDKALFGDKLDLNNQDGMIEMVKEMHSLFTSGKITAVFIRNIFLCIAFLAGLVISIKKLLF